MNIPNLLLDESTSNTVQNLETVNNDGDLSDESIRQVINPERLAQLLSQADAFGVVNSEKLDDF
ncbi:MULTISPECIES: hypothetical protein [unclassified Moraxella]|uniref:hypothetical protein n=1 Tax=unclassified Moraxella TaxID=2685852 RepID=UPI003AF960CF